MPFISSILNLYFRNVFFRSAARYLFVLVPFAIVAAILLQSSSVVTYPVGWERSFQLSPFNVAARNVDAHSIDDFIAVVYEGRAGAGQGIYASISFNAGDSFFPSVKVADAASKTELKPAVAVAPNGTISVVWDGFIESESTNRVFYSSSKDFGASWSSPRTLNLGTEKEVLPVIYYDKRGALHLFYHGNIGKTINIFHAVSPGGGEFKTGGSLIRRTSMRGEFLPSICVSDENLFIVWQGMEENLSDKLFFVSSSNYGASWSSPRQINVGARNSEVPSAVMHDGVIYVAYRAREERNWSIKMITSSDEGRSWDKAPLSVSTTPANCNSPVIGWAGGDIMILWYDNRSGRDKIYSRKYSIRDRTFMKEDEVSEARYDSRHPVVLPKGKKFLVFWEERNVVMAKQSDIVAEPPALYSDTNPTGRWSRLPYAEIRWRPRHDESGIAGYAVAMNERPDFNPLPVVNLNANVTKRRYNELNDGVSYFHIRAIDNAGNVSRTAHYKLMVSANPLPEPVIVSQTHQTGKPNPSHTADFTWNVAGMERVKGFNYSLSKDTISAPERFISDTKARFDDLEDGIYILKVAAVDKTNRQSRVSTYAFIVGTHADPDFYKKIAVIEDKGEKNRFGREKIKGTAGRAPSVSIKFPFDTGTAYGRDSFQVIIVSSNIDPSSIVGYSVYIDRDKQAVADRINAKRPVLEVQDLHSGEYYIGVKCKYARVINGATAYYWTKPYMAKIIIDIPLERSPIVYYAQRLLGDFPARFGLISLTFFGLTLMVTTLGFGKRIRFSAQRILFRIKIVFRLLFKKNEA
jgi:hypothetical protein